MAGRGAGLFVQIHRLWDLGTFAGLTDAQLLARFAAGDEDGSELAFEALQPVAVHDRAAQLRIRRRMMEFEIVEFGRARAPADVSVSTAAITSAIARLSQCF